LSNKKKKGREKPQREIAPHHLAQWQRQRRRQRFILIGGIVIVAAIAAIIFTGWYMSDYHPKHQTVIRVNDTKFDLSYLVDALKIQEGESAAYYQSLAYSMVSQIEQSELIRQGAAELGISVSDNEVEALLSSYGVVVNRATLDLGRTSLLYDKLKKEYFDAQVPQTAAQANILAMFLESESQAARVRATLASGGNFTALAGESSLESYSRTKKGEIGWHPADILTSLLGSSVPGDYALGAEAGSLSPPLTDNRSKDLGYWLIKILEKDGDTDAQIQALLLGSEDEANDVRSQLEAGGDLAALAKEHSQYDVSQKGGGEMGVVSKGDISTAFDDFAFNESTPVGVWSQPVSDNTTTTHGGYWLVKVLEKAAERQIDSTDRDSLMSSAYVDWVSAFQNDPKNKVESYLTSDVVALAAELAAGK
jgi:hypothetical protein